jgi:uncharacterized protein (DUF362 family)
MKTKLEGPVQNPKRSRLLDKPISRRGFLKGAMAGVCFSMFNPVGPPGAEAAGTTSPLFWIRQIPNQPFTDQDNGNYHYGVEQLLPLMGTFGLKFYRSSAETVLSGPQGLIAPGDVVLIKVNGQWKYRGCTNSDLIRGLIQRILDHPDGFTGEVVIFENGQGRGSLNCDNTGSGYPDGGVHANANDESHSFLYLVNAVFQDPRISAYLLDPIRSTFIGGSQHVTDGYRKFENVSYPCFTTAGGHRVELAEGIWDGSGYKQNLKLINVPVLKHHDTGGSEITASLKHFYGVVSMDDGQSSFRHYAGLGNTCGKMFVSVRTPVLNIIDATWVSHSALAGYPAEATARANQILASQDPVALDYWAAKYILFPISQSPRHLPDFPGVDNWLTAARDMINGLGGLLDPGSGILVDQVTKDEASMQVFTSQAVKLLAPDGGEVIFSGEEYNISWDTAPHAVKFNLSLSFDQGATWAPIPGAQDITGTSFKWLVPRPAGNKRKCVIKVTGFNSKGKKIGSDRSAAPFTIEVLKLTAPNGGETLFPGDVQPVTWETHGTNGTVAEVRIYYTMDGETTWKLIEVVPGDLGRYDTWTVPAPSRTKRRCKVKVVLMDDKGHRLGVDASDHFFVIESTPLT